jgi:molecular chaperone DnaK
VFSTTLDNQNLVRIRVLQGERELAVDNQLLGCFELVGIPPAPRGVPQIEVSFDIDADGILSVSAKDLGTGREQQIRVSASGGLEKEQVERLLAAAEAHADEDARRLQEVELRNTAEGLLYSVDQTLMEFGGHLSESETDEVLSCVDSAKKALAGEDVDALRAAVEELQQLAYRMTEAMYERLGSPDGDATDDPEENQA